MYNLNGLSFVVVTDQIDKLVASARWIPKQNPELSLYPRAILQDKLHGFFNGSEIPLAGLFDKYQFCLSEVAYFETIFNICSGLVLVFMFIFADLWRIVFSATITRSFPGDPHNRLIPLGAFYLACFQAVILTWLGVESGFSVVASAGDFSNVLYNSLANFIILSLDDQAMPFLRFIFEENGNLNHEGFLERPVLDSLTHGTQYFKPGYGVNWIKTIRTAPFVSRVIAVCAIPVVLTIVVAPLGVVIHFAVVSYARC